MFNTLIVYPLFNLLAIIYAFLPWHDFGVAIIILTILIRLLIWPLVNKQLHSQRAMQELQPELARIKAQAKGDRTLEGKLTMELYKEKEINPLGSLLPLLIQLPIFFALFAVLNDVVKSDQVAHILYPAVKELAPISNLLASGSTFHPYLFGVVDLSKPSLILAVLAGLAQFIQTKQLAPKRTSDDAQARITAGMIYLFPAITFVLGLTWPSALTLYWTTSSAVAILQQTLVLRRDVVEMEEVIDELPATTATVKSPAKTGKKHKKTKRAKA